MKGTAAQRRVVLRLGALGAQDERVRQRCVYVVMLLLVLAGWGGCSLMPTRGSEGESRVAFERKRDRSLLGPDDL